MPLAAAELHPVIGNRVHESDTASRIRGNDAVADAGQGHFEPLSLLVQFLTFMFQLFVGGEQRAFRSLTRDECAMST